MRYICTLIGDRASKSVSQDLVESIAQQLGNVSSVAELSPNVAYDIHLTTGEDTPIQHLRQRVRDYIGEAPIDSAVLPAKGRRKRLFLADMDSTMIEQECIDELAGELGLKDKIATITERAMRGEIDFEPALRERVGLLKGLNASIIDRVFETRITLTPGAREAIATMNANGTVCVLVSGGFTPFTAKVAQTLGFAADHANTLVIKDGILTGEVGEPIQGREAKRLHLQRYADDLAIDLDQTMAIGDGANDLAMIGAAGTGVAFRAKPTVQRQADTALTHADLTGVLYLQGYKDSEIVWRNA